MAAERGGGSVGGSFKIRGEANLPPRMFKQRPAPGPRATAVFGDTGPPLNTALGPPGVSECGPSRCFSGHTPQKSFTKTAPQFRVSLVSFNLTPRKISPDVSGGGGGAYGSFMS